MKEAQLPPNPNVRGVSKTIRGCQAQALLAGWGAGKAKDGTLYSPHPTHERIPPRGVSAAATRGLGGWLVVTAGPGMQEACRKCEVDRRVAGRVLEVVWALTERNSAFALRWATRPNRL